METIQIIYGALSLILIFILIYETKNYKEYLQAKHGLMSMGASMQAGFNSVVEHMNKLAQTNIELRQDAALKDQELAAMRAIVKIHSKQLRLEELDKLFVGVDKLKAIELEDG